MYFDKSRLIEIELSSPKKQSILFCNVLPCIGLWIYKDKCVVKYFFTDFFSTLYTHTHTHTHTHMLVFMVYGDSP